MKCLKARDLYFSSRDGLLDEIGRAKLAEHLAACPSCALFVKETDASLDLLHDLPEMSVSEGFEWNVKRRIHEERNRLMRRESGSLFGNARWLPRFAIGAAAAAVAAIAIGIFAVDTLRQPEPTVRSLARSDRPASQTAVAVNPGASLFDAGIEDGSIGPRMVSDNVYAIPRGASDDGSAFRFVAGSREDSLTHENELLRRRVDNLERQVDALKGLLERERAERINLRLP